MHTALNPHRKNIIILGAGYCGLRVAQQLAKSLTNNRRWQIVLVDQSAMHVYSADLYEIATAYYPRVTNACLHELSESVSVPYNFLFKNKPIIFVHDTAVKIDYFNKKVELQKHGTHTFEYLILALGSVTNFYGLPGVAENAFPLKTLLDALALECHFDQLFKQRWHDNDHSLLNIVVGGGGFTGVEYACELPGFILKLSQKYRFDPHEVKITVVQSGPELVGLGKKVSCITFKRLKILGIEVICNARICSYHNNKLEFTCSNKITPHAEKDTNKNIKRSIPAEILVWTAGVQPNPLLKNFPVLGRDGAMEVLPNLEAAHYPKVYAGGDNAAIFDPSHHGYLSKLGQLALQQAPVIAHNIWADINGQPQKSYKPLFKGFILALGAKYFVYNKNGFTIAGFIPWLMRRAFDFWYFSTLLPFTKALRKWWRTESIFLQND